MKLILRASTTAALSLMAVVLGMSTAFAAPANDVVDIAHRGASGSAPENTVAAVKTALQKKSSFVEVDIQRSADGELVIIHDTTLSRTTNVEEVFPDRSPWLVSDFTLAEMRQLDAGTWYSPDFAGEPIPTLREVVNALGKRAGLLLELKNPELYPGIETEIDKELSSIPGYMRGALAKDKLVIQSFNHVSVRTYDDIAPAVPTGLLFGTRPTDAELVAASGFAEQINPSYRVTDQSLVHRVQELDMTISVYTLNTGQLMRQFINLGVNGIITDYPAVLRDILRNRR